MHLIARSFSHIMKTQNPFYRIGNALVCLEKPTSTRPCNTMTVSDKLFAFTTSFACHKRKRSIQIQTSRSFFFPAK